MSSDRGSDVSSFHGALFGLATEWGTGGVLAQLEALAAAHDGLPHEAEALRSALARFTAAYAPAGSTSAHLAWRSTPCPLCAGEEAALERAREVSRG